jgi:hypothetical protein
MLCNKKYTFSHKKLIKFNKQAQYKIKYSQMSDKIYESLIKPEHIQTKSILTSYDNYCENCNY